MVLGTTWTIATHTTFATSVLTFVTILVGLSALGQREFFKLLPKAILICSVIEAIGMYMPLFSPSLYFQILSLLPGDTYVNAVGFLAQGRLCGFNPQTAYAGFFMSIGIAVLFNELVFHKESRNIRWLYILLLTFEVIALVMTFKRSGMLSVALVSIIILIYNKKISLVSVAKFVFVFFLVVVAAYQWIKDVPEVKESLELSTERFEQKDGQDITSGRGELANRAISIFEEHPILGIGYGGYSVDSDKGAHNVYLQVLCEGGIIGFLLYLPYMIVNLIKVIGCIRRKNGDLMLLNMSLFIQLYYIIYSGVGNCLTDNFIFLLYVLMASLPYAIENKSYSGKSGIYNLLFHN